MHSQSYSKGFSPKTLGANAPTDSVSTLDVPSTNLHAQITKLQELTYRIAHITYRLSNKNNQMFGSPLEASDPKNRYEVEPEGLLSQLNLAIINLDTEVADLETVSSVTLTI